MKISNEFKTGLVVFTAVSALAVIMYQTGDLNFGKKGYVVKARFENTGGVKKLAPVRLSGVEVGEVKNLQLLYEPGETLIEVTLWVEQEVRLRKDSEAIVSTLGLMGEKYIEIRSGASSDFVAEGGFIQSKEPIGIDELMEIYKGVGEDIQLTLSDFRTLVNNANEVVGENKPKLSRLMDNLEITSEYFLEFAEDVRHHPWKVLAKGKEKSPEEMAQLRAERMARRLERKKAAQALAAEAEAKALPSEDVPIASKDKDQKKSGPTTNFSSGR